MPHRTELSNREGPSRKGDDDCIFKRENEKMARATAQLQAVMKARKKLLLGRDRARAKKAIADAQMNDPNCIFGREVREPRRRPTSCREL